MTNSDHDDDGFAEDDLSEFTDIIDLLRSGPSDVAKEDAPPSVWAGIEREIAAADADTERTVASVSSLTDARAARSVGKTAAIVLAVAAALLLVALPIGLAVRSSDDGAELAADLDALGDFGGWGSAEVDGDELQIEVEGLEAAEGWNYELWLLKPDVSDLVWVGVVAEDGTFVIPAGTDLNEFSVVDISLEPDDGDESHSGNSVLRGSLDET